MKFQLLGASSPEESVRERAHRAIAREAAAEGIVLLENNGVLPMQPQKIALYGAGLWNLMYLYVWPIVVLAALPFRRSESRAFWAAIAGLHGLCFGALCAIPYFFIGGWQMAFLFPSRNLQGSLVSRP